METQEIKSEETIKMNKDDEQDKISETGDAMKQNADDITKEYEQTKSEKGDGSKRNTDGIEKEDINSEKDEEQHTKSESVD